MTGPAGAVGADTTVVSTEGGTLVTTGTDVGEAAVHVRRLAAFADPAAEDDASDFRSAWGTGLRSAATRCGAAPTFTSTASRSP